MLVGGYLLVFRIHLHRHVKIWFHIDTNKNNFINYENRLRLIEFRQKNPNDKISFVYSKNLLSSSAQENLLSFCKEHEFEPLAIEDLAQEIKTDADQTLYKYMMMELVAAKNNTGGNLAVASDIARWLKPIYTRGIYSDLDVKVNTVGLPEILLIDKPYLTNYGTIVEGENKQSLMCNNDILMIGEINDTLSDANQINARIELNDIINKVVEWISNCYSAISEHLSKILKNELNELKKDLPKNYWSILEEEFFNLPKTKQLSLFINKGYGDNPIEIRNNLDKKYSSCYEYVRLQINASKQALAIFTEEYGAGPDDFIANDQLKHVIVDFYANQTATTPQLQDFLEKNGSEKYAQVTIAAAHHDLYKMFVINTIGPKLFFSLMGGTFFSNEEVKSKVVYFSLIHYGLSKSFQSNVPMTLNAKSAPSASLGQGSDLYWLPLGKQVVEERERELAAIKIQRQWRLFHPKPESIENSEGVDHGVCNKPR